MRRLGLLLLCGACSQPFTSEQSATQDLPDPRDGVKTDGCDDLSGEPIAGAATYFFGELELQDDGNWKGSESWLLFANPTWIDAGFSDCVITWAVSGFETSTGSCSGCSLGLQLSAAIDLQSTTCEEELYTGEEQFDVLYDVLLSSDGTATWYFSESGSTLGEGYYSDEAMNYLTDHQCAWF